MPCHANWTNSPHSDPGWKAEASFGEVDRTQAQARNCAVEDGIIGGEARALGHRILLFYHLAYHR